jgi:hypothetical protein
MNELALLEEKADQEGLAQLDADAIMVESI